MKTDISQIISRGAEKLGISLPANAAALFELYYKILIDHAQKFNLTTVTDPEGVASSHFLDSLALLNIADFNKADVIDVGSGAGFPGIPIKIAKPSIRLTLLDATRKRVDFLSQLCVELGIETRCIHARAEEILHGAKRADGIGGKSGKNGKDVNNCEYGEDGGSGEKFRQHFDIAVSRAVAGLNVLSELCLPFVRVGGVFLAMKGLDSEAEISEAINAIETLGGRFEKKVDYTIPAADGASGGDRTHSIIVIRKVQPTPEKYPRRFAKITKSPL